MCFDKTVQIQIENQDLEMNVVVKLENQDPEDNNDDKPKPKYRRLFPKQLRRLTKVSFVFYLKFK